jgi:hypothetical protein
MFMNYAPVIITGPGPRNFECPDMKLRREAAFNALPTMFVANIENGCRTDKDECADKASNYNESLVAMLLSWTI